MVEEEEEEEEEVVVVEGKCEVVEEVMKAAEEKGEEEGLKWEKEMERRDVVVLLVVKVQVHLEGLVLSLH